MLNFRISIFLIILKEIKHRLFTYICATVIISLCVGSLFLSKLILINFDVESNEIIKRSEEESTKTLEALENKIRKEMKGLGFNIYIFPEGQNLAEVYSKGYASKTMPEEYAQKLANTKTLSKINHLLPSLTQKILWPEEKRTIILVGIKGEIPIPHKSKNSPKSPLINPVPPGKVIIGYELQQSLDLKVNTPVKILGKEFIISSINEARGSADDITMWINLDECQKILNKEKQINAILALECNCSSIDRLGEIRKEVQAILPGTQIVEVKSSALARAEARMATKKASEKQISIIKNQRYAMKTKISKNSILLLIISVFISAIIIWILSIYNVKHRLSEIGVYKALGFSNNKVIKIFLGRLLLIGFLGTAVGLLLGFITSFFLNNFQASQLLNITEYISVILSGILIAVTSGLYSCYRAIHQDPAIVMRSKQ